MPVRARVVLVVLWVASLIAVRVIATEQSQGMQPLRSGPIIVSGEDIGFRIEGTIGDAPAGTLVIRRNGVWVEPRGKQGLVPTR